jgi:hypothetical protein
MQMISPDDFGTETDGKKCDDYCAYCYKDGAFLEDVTMEEMISLYADRIESWELDVIRDDIVAKMYGVFPTLKRWRR